MNVALRKRKNSDSTTRLRSDIYHNRKRSVETFKYLKLAKPSNPVDREANCTFMFLIKLLLNLFN